MRNAGPLHWEFWGLLARADWLIVCWTPNSVNRHWCTYVITNWLRVTGIVSVTFMPVSHAREYLPRYLQLHPAGDLQQLPGPVRGLVSRRVTSAAASGMSCQAPGWHPL